MDSIWDGFSRAFGLLIGFDPDLWQIIILSLQVSLAAVAVAALFGLPLGAILAVYRFPGRKACVVGLSALMGLPPVVVGLAAYLILSRSGPLGDLGLLFTPWAMIIAQAFLVLPIIAALTRQVIEERWDAYGEQLRSFGATPGRAIRPLLWDARTALVTTVLAGMGRAMAEVGAVIIVGGNIAHHTRVMTTAIALETGKGNLALALGLGMVLLVLALALNAAAYLVAEAADRPRRAAFR